ARSLRLLLGGLIGRGGLLDGVHEAGGLGGLLGREPDLGLGTAVPRGVRGVELHRALVALDGEALGGGAVGLGGRGSLTEGRLRSSRGGGSSRRSLGSGDVRGGQGQGRLSHEVLERTGGEDHVVTE